MSVLIKGMEMPKNCGLCFLRVGKCSRRIYMKNRPSDCPLIEVPEPHGRLIDADALANSEDCKRKGCVYQEEIFRAPTIIQASEEET